MVKMALKLRFITTKKLQKRLTIAKMAEIEQKMLNDEGGYLENWLEIGNKLKNDFTQV